MLVRDRFSGRISPRLSVLDRLREEEAPMLLGPGVDATEDIVVVWKQERCDRDHNGASRYFRPEPRLELFL